MKIVEVLVFLTFITSCFGWMQSPRLHSLQYNGRLNSFLARNLEKNIIVNRSPRQRSFLSRIDAGLFDAVFGGSKSDITPSSAESARSSNADAWEEVTDPSSGAKYFWNRETGATAWDRPVNLDPSPSATSAPPKDAAATADEGGRVQYAMPSLYNGWFAGTYSYMGADGETERTIAGTDEVAQQCISAVNRALADGLTRLEVVAQHTPDSTTISARARARIPPPQTPQIHNSTQRAALVHTSKITHTGERVTG